MNEPTEEASKVKKHSLRGAINEKCKDCIYDPLAGGSWRKQVELCTCTDCPLYPVRPMTYGSKPKTNGNFRYKNRKDGKLAPKLEFDNEFNNAKAGPR